MLDMALKVPLEARSSQSLEHCTGGLAPLETTCLNWVLRNQPTAHLGLHLTFHNPFISIFSAI